MAPSVFWCTSLRGKAGEGEKRMACHYRLNRGDENPLWRGHLSNVYINNVKSLLELGGFETEMPLWGGWLWPLPCHGQSYSWLHPSGGFRSPHWRASHTSAWAPPRCPPPSWKSTLLRWELIIFLKLFIIQNPSVPSEWKPFRKQTEDRKNVHLKSFKSCSVKTVIWLHMLPI